MSVREKCVIDFKGSKRLFLTAQEWETLKMMAPSYDDDNLRSMIEWCGRKAGRLKKPALVRKLISFVGF